MEKNEKPDFIFNNVAYLHLPIFDEAKSGITHEKSDLANKLRTMPDLAGLYNLMMTDEFCISQLSKVVNEIVNSANYSVLFHCSAGKDRTGIVSMLILSILDVPEETIYNDYLSVNKGKKLKANLAYLVALMKVKDKKIASKVKQLFIIQKEYLESAINTMITTSGSVQNFIREKLKISDEMKENFKNKVLI